MRKWVALGFGIPAMALAAYAFDMHFLGRPRVGGVLCDVWTQSDGNICRYFSGGHMCTLSARIDYDYSQPNAPVQCLKPVF
jgi:hypothetical protein